MFKFLIYCFFIVFTLDLHALTTLHITINTDNNPGGDGEPGDLRYCLNTMNQNLNTSSDDYAIVFDYPMTIHLNGILPIINNSDKPVNITIGNASPSPSVIIDGANTFRGFFIPMGSVTIQNLRFQNMLAKGGNGGDGISGGGGGMGAGGAIYAPGAFLNGASPSIRLINVSIENSSAQGGNGGNYIESLVPTGNEGGGGGGGFSGDGGSITTTGSTGGGGGGGFGGNGGNVTLSTNDTNGGGGGGGGGIGSLATQGTLTNLGNGGNDNSPGGDGNGYGLTSQAGTGAGGLTGGNNAGGGGGGAGSSNAGGGGGGSSGGNNGYTPLGNIPASPSPSGGVAADGGGGGGGGVVLNNPSSNDIDGQAGQGGYAGGGGGGAGLGFSDTNYTVQGGTGGTGGGGGGGGGNHNGSTSGNGGDSTAGGGGGGGGPSYNTTATGGVDQGKLGGGSGGDGANDFGSNYGGGGGGGGSGLGGAIFIDSGLNFIIQAIPNTPTTFNTSNCSTTAGQGGSAGSGGGTDGSAGSSLGDSIFIRSGSILTLLASDTNDILTLGSGVKFSDDSSFGGTGTDIYVKGKGNIIYGGSSDYQGNIRIYNANFRVNNTISQASISVCRDTSIGTQRGILSGHGNLTGDIFANSGTISPESNGTLTLGNLTLLSASTNSLGSLVHIQISGNTTSSVHVTNAATLAGTLEVTLEPNAQPGTYTLLQASSITGTFDDIQFTGQTPTYTLSYLPAGAPTQVQLNFLGYVDIPATINGSSVISPAAICCGRPVLLGPLPIPGSEPTIYSITNQTGNIQCQIRQNNSQTYVKISGKGTCTIVGNKNGFISNPLTLIAQ